MMEKKRWKIGKIGKVNRMVKIKRLVSTGSVSIQLDYSISLNLYVAMIRAIDVLVRHSIWPQHDKRA